MVQTQVSDVLFIKVIVISIVKKFIVELDTVMLGQGGSGVPAWTVIMENNK